MELTQEIRQVTEEAECLHDLRAVRTAIERMGREITAILKDENPLVLSVLNGGIFFTSELLLYLPFPLELDSIKAGRYQGATAGSTMQWQVEPTLSVEGRTILVLDDILDEGITLAEIHRYLEEKGAKRIVSAVLVDKDLGRTKPYRADHVGLVTENRYLFGFGLDYKGYLRNWPGIYACRTIY
ncbi:MAG: hypothetical protein RLZZ627_2121 [Pseudomonadota bacterium]|jgi:hypoxanthine phosphoribosyltransferase